MRCDDDNKFGTSDGDYNGVRSTSGPSDSSSDETAIIAIAGVAAVHLHSGTDCYGPRVHGKTWRFDWLK